MANWKVKNPLIKISISVGGWDEQSKHFTPMVSNDANRKSFCQSVVNITRKYNFDGIGEYHYLFISFSFNLRCLLIRY